jgi:DNA-binding response OmpR family regulator
MQKKILFCSDDFSYGLSLLMFFSEKYFVTSTTDMESIPKLFEQNKFDLIIIDKEPETSVLNLCKNLKSKAPSPIIILTYAYNLKEGHKNEDLIKRYIDFIFYKPIDLVEVTRALHMSKLVLN